MFGLFQNKKQNEEEVAHEISTAISVLIEIQMNLCTDYPEKLVSNFALGYVAGMVDGAMFVKGLAKSERSDFEYMVVGFTFMKVYGDAYGLGLSKKLITMMENGDKEADEGLRCGVNDITKVMTEEGRRALGLMAYCHGLE